MKNPTYLLLLSTQVSDFKAELANVASAINWWYVAVIIEGLVILAIIAILFKAHRNYQSDKNKYEHLKNNDILNKESDAFARSTQEAKKLHKALCHKCHPDLFEDEHQKKIAHRLFQEMSISRNNLAKLKKLKAKAEEELGVKI
ncbi:hypothetical protein B0O79_1407 [Flavobacteriaceae bacterium MAR_2009_75]|nr:hypothetical protein B0O79_1407 [Flavobacteriaceae bacterium MAR_2009_75]